ncbi:helix-turn-helix transcriptional regulator [Mumia sp. DW29H23]|uniref:helix-turn-helix transcriptional regulator n=1 Tax=Mumia sp. DW29H23 TaxID=3421241 RepID=UPI003D69B55F
MNCVTSPSSELGRALVGRQHECRALDEVVAEVHQGRARVVVLRGEPGVGKTALLRYLADHAHGCTVLRASGVESEMELAYAGLHQLLAPLLGLVDRLPEPQRDALRVVFGLNGTGAPDPFLVGVAVLGLLSESSAQRSLVCVVDDAHWLDRASAEVLAFVGRRLAAIPVGLAFTARPEDEGDLLRGLPEIPVTGLSDREARMLLQSVVHGPLDEGILRRLLAEADGNPLAILELPRGLAPGDLAGGFGMLGVGGLPSRIELSYQRRLEPLTAATRRLLLIVAAEPRQDAVLIWRAAAHLGLGPDDAVPAVNEGLVDFGGEVRFSHPLVRSTVYRTASPEERRAVHRALAETTSHELEPDRHAWHLAQATAGLDESVAVELVRSAGRALARGGLAAAAAFRERAAALTPDPARRAQRALRAAQARFQSGAPDRALQLLPIVEENDAEAMLAAEVYLLRAQIAAALGNQHAESLLSAARRLEPLDRTLTSETYRDAFEAALIRGRVARRDGVIDVANAVRAALPGSSVPDPTTGLLNGFARTVVDGYRSGAPLLRESLAALAATDLSTEEMVRWLPLATRMSHDVWDEGRWRDLSGRMISIARESGRLRMLPVGLLSRSALELFTGNLPAARDAARECAAVVAATNHPSPPYWDLVIAGWCGNEQRVVRLIADAAADATAYGDGQWLTACAWTTAVMHNGLGGYSEALLAAEDGSAHPEELGLASWSAVELVEAAARAGLPERGREALRRITDAADACRTDWALGIAARSRALLADGAEAEADYREAIERLGRTPLRFFLARAHLVYGEWLRRENRRLDAREQLKVAHEMLAEMGADGFAGRARRELAATGATARRRSVETMTDLTEQESQVARLAAQGHTNPEIAGQLFISPRTVEWHLRKVYSKLGISSRKEVQRALVMDLERVTA